MRQIMLPHRYVDVVSFALTIANEIEVTKPRTYKEAVASKDKGKQGAAMDE